MITKAFFVFIAVAALALAGVSIYSAKSGSDFQERCNARGGVTVRSWEGGVCIPRAILVRVI